MSQAEHIGCEQFQRRYIFTMYYVYINKTGQKSNASELFTDQEWQSNVYFYSLDEG